MIDSITKTQDYFASIILNASTLNTNLILLNSMSSRFPKGLGNDNGLLGKYIAFHNYRATISAKYEGFPITVEGQNQQLIMYPDLEMYLGKKLILRGYAAGFKLLQREKPLKRA